MTRRYLYLLAGILGVAVVLSVIGLPRSGPRTEKASAVPATPAFDLALVIEDGRVLPALASVPRGSRVRLHVENRGHLAARLTLAGYDHELAIPELAPGARWQGSFLADLPGEDFAWLVDGNPAARLAVTGSHLVEGHR